MTVEADGADVKQDGWGGFFLWATRVFKNREPVGIAILTLLSIYSLYIVLLPLSSAVSQFAIDRYHLKLSHGSWAAVQLSPSMYNFKNKVGIWPVQLQDGQQVLGQPIIKNLWLNHHVARTAYELGKWLKPGRGCYLIVLESEFAPVQQSSKYFLCKDPEVRSLNIEAVVE